MPAGGDEGFGAEAGDLLAGLPGVQAVTLGGSRAAGTAGPESDWDFAVYYTAGAIAVAACQGAHAVLAARGQWITNEKTLIDRAGLRSIDQILAGLSAGAGDLLSAVDQAAAVLCPAG